MKDDIKDIKRRAGITESSPLLMMLLQATKTYASVADREGEEEAADALMQQGLSVQQIQVIAQSYQNFVKATRDKGNIH